MPDPSPGPLPRSEWVTIGHEPTGDSVPTHHGNGHVSAPCLGGDGGMSGRAESNCRPPGPKPGALPLGHAPVAGEAELEAMS